MIYAVRAIISWTMVHIHKEFDRLIHSNDFRFQVALPLMWIYQVKQKQKKRASFRIKSFVHLI